MAPVQPPSPGPKPRATGLSALAVALAVVGFPTRYMSWRVDAVRVAGVVMSTVRCCSRWADRKLLEAATGAARRRTTHNASASAQPMRGRAARATRLPMPSLLLLLLSASPALSKNYSGTVANVWAHVRRRPELLRAHRVMANIHPEHGGDSERSSRVKVVPTGVEELIARAMNPERLALLVNRTRANYRAGEPFPHAVIDGLFPESLLDRLAAEIPEDQANGTASCAIGTNCFRNPKAEYLKGYIGKLNLMGKVTQTFFSFFLKLRSCHEYQRHASSRSYHIHTLCYADQALCLATCACSDRETTT